MNAEEKASFTPLAEGVQPGQMQHRGVDLHGGLPGSQAAAVSASLQEGRETETIGCNRPGEGGQRVESSAAGALLQEVQETPRGALPGGLPGSRAAAVTASLQESRETGTTGVHRPVTR